MASSVNGMFPGQQPTGAHPVGGAPGPAQPSFPGPAPRGQGASTLVDELEASFEVGAQKASFAPVLALAQLVPCGQNEAKACYYICLVSLDLLRTAVHVCLLKAASMKLPVRLELHRFNPTIFSLFKCLFGSFRNAENKAVV